MQSLRLLFYTLFVFVTCIQCGRDRVPDGLSKHCLVDSFTVRGFRSAYELKSLHMINDSTLLSYSHELMEISMYTLTPGTRQFSFASSVPTSISALAFRMQRNSSGGYTILDEGLVFHDFDARFQPVHQRKLTARLSDLGNDYSLLPGQSEYTAQAGDTIIVRYMTNSPNAHLEKQRTHELVELVSKGDSLQWINSLFENTAERSRYLENWPLWVFHQNKILLMYGCYDTVYVYDRSQKAYSRHAIGNPRYTLPEPWDESKLGQADYNTYKMKYCLKMFVYESFRYNPRSGHYICHYVLPLECSAKTEDRMPLPEDKTERVLVLDSNFQIIADYLTSGNYWPSDFAFMIPSKGLARPLFKGPLEYDELKFHVFNF